MFTVIPIVLSGRPEQEGILSINFQQLQDDRPWQPGTAIVKVGGREIYTDAPKMELVAFSDARTAHLYLRIKGRLTQIRRAV